MTMLSKMRFAVLLAAFAAMGLAGTAQAQAPGGAKPVSGSGQAFVGGGLPVPILRISGPQGFGGAGIPSNTYPYRGGFQALAGLGSVQTGGGATPSIVFSQNAATRPQFPFTIGVVQANPEVFQVRTNIGIPVNTTLFPQTLSAGGRSGPPTITVCPGTLAGTGAAAVAGRPNMAGCVGPNPAALPGLVRYQNLANQFGGPLQGRIVGTADVAANAGGVTQAGGAQDIANCVGQPAPAFCLAAMFQANPNTGPGAAGGPWGFVGLTTGTAVPSNVLNVSMNVLGTIAAGIVVGATPLTNDGTTWGGPYTTGAIFMSQPAAFGDPEVFSITGSDGRNSTGNGPISLVTSTISRRIQTGPNANRNFLTLVVPEPSAIAAAGTALAALAGLHGWLRRRNA